MSVIEELENALKKIEELAYERDELKDALDDVKNEFSNAQKYIVQLEGEVERMIP